MQFMGSFAARTSSNHCLKEIGSIGANLLTNIMGSSDNGLCGQIAETTSSWQTIYGRGKPQTPQISLSTGHESPEESIS